MLGLCCMYVQGSGWGSCAMLNRRHYLCIYRQTRLCTGMDLETFSTELFAIFYIMLIVKVGKRFLCHRVIHPVSTGQWVSSRWLVAQLSDYLAPHAEFMLEVKDYLALPVEFMLGVEDDQVMGSNGVLIANYLFFGLRRLRCLLEISY